MNNAKDISTIIDKIKGVDGVKRVAIISRNGMHIYGDMFPDNDSFSAMSAIIMGAGENLLRGEAKYVVVRYPNFTLTIVPAGDRGVLAVQSDRDVYEDIEAYVKDFDSLI